MASGTRDSAAARRRLVPASYWAASRHEREGKGVSEGPYHDAKLRGCTDVEGRRRNGETVAASPSSKGGGARARIYAR